MFILESSTRENIQLTSKLKPFEKVFLKMSLSQLTNRLKNR